MDKKKKDDIILKLSKVLKGDPAKDQQLIAKVMKAYQNDADKKEIMTLLNEYNYQFMSKKQKKKYDKQNKVEYKENDVYSEIRQAAKFCEVRDFEKACEVIEHQIEIANKLLEQGNYKNDDKTAYICFNSTFQQVYYKYLNENEDVQKRIINCNYPFDQLYATYASILIELQRYQDAVNAIDTAMFWNPVEANYLYETAEIFSAIGQWQQYKYLTLKGLELAYQPETVARAYRNLGYMYRNLGEYQKCYNCYIMSLNYEVDSAVAKNACDEVCGVSPYLIQQLEPKEMREFLIEEGLPLGPNSEIVSFAYELANELEFSGQEEESEYFLDIYNDLTGHAQ